MSIDLWQGCQTNLKDDQSAAWLHGRMPGWIVECKESSFEVVHAKMAI